MITKEEFIALAEKVAAECRTVYAKGAIGSPVTASFLESKGAQYPEFYTASKKASLLAKAKESDKPLFAFDCICFVKSLLWGWVGDAAAPFGGAVYASNGVPDVSVEGMKELCLGVSSDFAAITPGELLFMPGHVGIYVGGGIAVECTSKWQGGVLLSGVDNVGSAGNCNGRSRTWSSHGRLPWFEGKNDTPPAASAKSADISLPVLEKGAKSEAVRAMQALLTLRGHQPGKCGSDASFGADTRAAVLAFQKANGIAQDGICGRKTWTALLAA